MVLVSEQMYIFHHRLAEIIFLMNLIALEHFHFVTFCLKQISGVISPQSRWDPAMVSEISHIEKITKSSG